MRHPLAALIACTLLILTPSPLWSSPALPEERQETPAKETLPPPLPKEVLDKIEAPAAKRVIKTKQGYTVEIDLTKQVLTVSVPKQDILVSPRVEAGQTVEVVVEDAPVQKVAEVRARLKKGRLLYTTEEKGDWVLTQIVEDGKLVKGWVQKKHLKPVAEDYPPQKSLTQPRDNFASAAMLIQKAKQFDDGLYAAVELAVQNGLGPVSGKKAWLPRLAAEVDASQGGVPLVEMFAAVQLGGGKPPVPPGLAPLMEKELKEFLADEKRSKPIGFYPWSKELQSIFQQDRMLQTSLEAQKHAAEITALAKALAADAEARKSYEQVLTLNERLTNPPNPLMGRGYRDLLASIDGGKAITFRPMEEVAFIPASRSHETDLFLKLFGNQPVPEGFNLMEEVITRLKDGRLSFAPKEDSGWYDHQLWSLEPLVRFDVAPESSRVKPNGEYRKHLEELFKGTYALLRETHIKQLGIPGSAPSPIVKEREKVFISPDPHVELLPTMYLRRAQSYQFVRKVLEETFGKENVAQMHRQTASGPLEMNLAAELDQMESLFCGAYIVACREIGMAEKLAGGLGSEKGADEDARLFLRWVASLASDPDLAPDCRMMVPVFFVPKRGAGPEKIKVWVMLGWSHANCTVSYVKKPAVKITDPDGKPRFGPGGPPGIETDEPEFIFSSSYRQLATPVFAEVYVTKILDREEFRRHCDVYQSKAAILANLE